MNPLMAFGASFIATKASPEDNTHTITTPSHTERILSRETPLRFSPAPAGEAFRDVRHRNGQDHRCADQRIFQKRDADTHRFWNPIQSSTDDQGHGDVALLLLIRSEMADAAAIG